MNPCPNDGCDDGFILVYNAYSETPLVGQREPCDICNGTDTAESKLN